MYARGNFLFRRLKRRVRRLIRLYLTTHTRIIHRTNKSILYRRLLKGTIRHQIHHHRLRGSIRTMNVLFRRTTSTTRLPLSTTRPIRRNLIFLENTIFITTTKKNSTFNKRDKYIGNQDHNDFKLNKHTTATTKLFLIIRGVSPLPVKNVYLAT